MSAGEVIGSIVLQLLGQKAVESLTSTTDKDDDAVVQHMLDHAIKKIDQNLDRQLDRATASIYIAMTQYHFLDEEEYEVINDKASEGMDIRILAPYEIRKAMAPHPAPSRQPFGFEGSYVIIDEEIGLAMNPKKAPWDNPRPLRNLERKLTEFKHQWEYHARIPFRHY